MQTLPPGRRTRTNPRIAWGLFVKEEKAKAQKTRSKLESAKLSVHELKINPWESAPLDFGRRPRKHRRCQIHTDEPCLAPNVSDRFE